MKLSDKACKAAQSKEKPYKLMDGDNMYLLIQPSGSKLWRLNYRFEGKQNTLALGQYPKVKLALARKKREEARAMLDEGINPSLKRAKIKLLREVSKDDTFEAVAKEWHAKQDKIWSPKYDAQVLQVMKINLFPYIGKMKLDDISPIMMRATLKHMEERGALDLLKDALNYASRVFQYGIITSRATVDPTSALKHAFKKHKAEHHPSIHPDALPAFLRSLRQQPDGMGKLGIEFVLLTLARTTEVRAAVWSEFKQVKNKDAIEGEPKEDTHWVIDTKRMKIRNGSLKEHVVPLSRQALEIKTKIKKSFGGEDYLFPNAFGRGDYMSENTMLNLIYEMGYKGVTTVHGLRTVASTVLHESGLFDSLAIEGLLSHTDKNQVRAAYNQAKYIKERKRIVQWWADYLDEQAAKKD